MAVLAHTLPIVEPPRSVSVIEGSVTEFSCKIQNRTVEYFISWGIRWNKDKDDTRTLYISGHQESQIDINQLSDQHHGSYSNMYVRSGNLEEYKLRIKNVTKNDEMFEFTCLVFPLLPQLNSEWVSLTILIPPSEPLQCSYTYPGYTTPADIPQEGIEIQLTCSLSSGDPKPVLRWQTFTDEHILSSNVTDKNNLVYTLLPEDGQIFVCQAFSPALNKPLTCSIIPNSISPVASLSTAEVHISSFDYNITLVCQNKGRSTPDTYFRWFWGQSQLEMTEILTGFKITTNDDISTLKIDGKITDTNITEITCQILVPQVSSSNASAKIIYLGENVKSSSKMEKTSAINAIIVSSAIVGSIILFVVGVASGISLERHLISKRTNEIETPNGDLEQENVSQMDSTSSIPISHPQPQGSAAHTFDHPYEYSIHMETDQQSIEPIDQVYMDMDQPNAVQYRDLTLSRIYPVHASDFTSSLCSYHRTDQPVLFTCREPCMSCSPECETINSIDNDIELDTYSPGLNHSLSN